MESRLIEDTQALKELKGKKLIMVFGQTGSGKSTLCNRLKSGADVIKYNDKEGVFQLEKGKEVIDPVSQR